MCSIREWRKYWKARQGRFTALHAVLACGSAQWSSVISWFQGLEDFVYPPPHISSPSVQGIEEPTCWFQLGLVTHTMAVGTPACCPDQGLPVLSTFPSSICCLPPSVPKSAIHFSSSVTQICGGPLQQAAPSECCVVLCLCGRGRKNT